MLQIAWSSAVSVRDQQKSTSFYICIKIITLDSNKKSTYSNWRLEWESENPSSKMVTNFCFFKDFLFNSFTNRNFIFVIMTQFHSISNQDCKNTYMNCSPKSVHFRTIVILGKWKRCDGFVLVFIFRIKNYFSKENKCTTIHT